MSVDTIRLLPLLAVTLSVACVKQRTPLLDPASAAVSGKVGGQRPGASTDANLSRKRLDSKVDPATLVAIDGSRCTVTESRYRDIKVGDTVSCDWRVGSREP